MHLAFGRRGFFGYSVDDGHAGWFANLPSDRPLTAAEARQVPEQEWLRRLKDVYADDTLPALAMLDRVRPGELVNVGGMYDMPPVPVWHRGRVVLVGDAAHATSPSSGQGASLAVESAVELARCLRDLPIDAAFEAYEQARRPRVEKIIAKTARINADKAPGPVGRIIRDLTFPIAVRTFYKPGEDDGLDAPLRDRLGREVPSGSGEAMTIARASGGARQRHDHHQSTLVAWLGVHVNPRAPGRPPGRSTGPIPLRVRRGARRRVAENGSKQPRNLVAGDDRPGVGDLEHHHTVGRVPLRTPTQPPSATLYRTPFSTRFCTSRSSSTGLPTSGAGPASTCSGNAL